MGQLLFRIFVFGVLQFNAGKDTLNLFLQILFGPEHFCFLLEQTRMIWQIFFFQGQKGDDRFMDLCAVINTTSGKDNSYLSHETTSFTNIHKNHCILSLDSSGSSLHRRGYRPAMGIAPLKETLAAALIAMSEWNPDLPFLDPLCGSGTLPIESALIALNIAPGLYRQQFGFQTWLDFDESLWQEIRQEAEAGKLFELSEPIRGSDRDLDIIEQAEDNAINCGLAAQVEFYQQELAEIEAPADKGVIICNPPYGQRIGNTEELGALYKLLGDIFKQRFTGWTAYVLTGNKELSKKIGLRTSRRLPVYNGSLPCTLLKYELY